MLPFFDYSYLLNPLIEVVVIERERMVRSVLNGPSVLFLSQPLECTSLLHAVCECSMVITLFRGIVCISSNHRLTQILLIGHNIEKAVALGAGRICPHHCIVHV